MEGLVLWLSGMCVCACVRVRSRLRLAVVGQQVAERGSFLEQQLDKVPYVGKYGVCN